MNNTLMEQSPGPSTVLSGDSSPGIVSHATATAQPMDENRLVTILFCDIAGSTAMSEQVGSEEWAEIMHEAFGYFIQPIERFGGTISRLMGDSVLAFFGAPRAHADDPQRAILAGLGILDAIKPFRARLKRDHGLDFNVRIGINTGVVVVGDFGSRDRFEYTAMGDAINLAARLEQSAERGTILVGHSTYHLTTPFFEFESLGEIEIRGKNHLEPVYRVIRAVGIPGSPWDVAGLEMGLVDREHEMDILREAYRELREGRGRILLIVGEAGVGKSRLIDELRRHWQTQPDHEHIGWLENRLLSYESLQPYGALQQRLRRAFGIDPQDSIDIVRAKVSAVTAPFPAEIQGRALRVIERVLSPADARDVTPLDPTASSVEAESFRREMNSVMTELLRAWNHGDPLIFVGDDYHWLDSASVEVVGNVLRLAEEAPILFVCAFRPDRNRPVWGIRDMALSRFAEHCIEIELAPLEDADAQKLVDSIITFTERDQSLREMILRKAEGNPLFVEEIVRSLSDQGLLRPAGDGALTCQVAPGVDSSDVSIPDSLQALILERLDRLDPVTRRVLQVASVIGRSFPYALLEAVSDTPIDLGDHLDTLERQHLIHETVTDGERLYEFRHGLIWEVVYSTLLRRHRQEFHRRVGEAMEVVYQDRLDAYSGNLGHHYFQAGDARALHWLMEAANRARTLYEPSVVIDFVTQANDLARRLELTLPADALQIRGMAYEMVGDYAKARDDFSQLLENSRSAGDGPLEWQALISLGIAWTERDYTRTGQYFSEALELARRQSDDAMEAHSLDRLGNWYSNTGRPREAFEAHQQALQLFTRLGSKDGLAEALDMLGMACYLAGDLQGSRRFYSEAIELFEELDNRVGLASSLAMITETGSTALTTTVVPATSLERNPVETAERGLRIAREIGWQSGESFALLNLSLAEGIRGDFQCALEHVEAAIRIAETIGHRQWILASHAGRGALMRDLLQLEDARQDLEFALSEARAVGSEFWTSSSTALLASVEIAAQRFERARILVDSGLESDRQPDSLGRRQIWSYRAELELELGNVDEALSIINLLKRTAPGVTEEDGISPYLSLLHARALIKRGEHAAARPMLESARDRAEALGYRPILWRIEQALGSVYRMIGDQPSADHHTQSAVAIVRALAGDIVDVQLREGFLREAMKLMESTRV